MILLAFFFPLAIYLIVLGLINRRHRPVLVSGVWDGVGVVFAASGFLLFTGPAIFTSLRERWRVYWLFGQGSVPAEGAWQFWIFLSILYFVLIVGGTALYFWRQRHLTSLYNVDAAQIEQTVTQICAELGLNPVRSGGLFLFGLSVERLGGGEGRLEAHRYLPSGGIVSREPLETLPQTVSGVAVPDATIVEQTTILELDGFPLMRHVTLRWDPADSPLRPVLETELSHRLAELPEQDSALGSWLLTFGSLLLAFEVLFAFALVLLQVLPR